MTSRQTSSTHSSHKPDASPTTKNGSQRSEHQRTSSSSRNEKDANDARAAAAIPAPPPRSGVKRFFLKVSEKVGGIEQTQYSTSFMESCTEVDNYKLSLEHLTTNLLGIAQRNPKLHSHPMERMEFEYHDNQNPFEALYPALNNVSEKLKDGGHDLKKQLDATARLGPLHRDFHRRARRCLRSVRLFLCIEYDELCEARKVLNERRQDMDFAKHELKNAKAPEVVEMKNLVYENAQRHFESQLQKVLQLLDQFPKWRDSHLKDIQNFHTIFKVYHEQVSLVLTSK